MFGPSQQFVVPEVTQIESNSALAENNGLRAGDRILAIDGERLYVQSDFNMILNVKGGETHSFTVRRNGERITLPEVSTERREFPDSNGGTQLTAAVGRIAEAYAPGIFGNGEGGQNNDVWGVQPIIGNAEGQIYDHSRHDIYRGMNFTSGLYERSIYTFEGAGVKGDHNCMWDLNAYGLAPNPAPW